MLKDYHEAWSLDFIGSSNEAFVPIAFVKREDLKKQRSVLQPV